MTASVVNPLLLGIVSKATEEGDTVTSGIEQLSPLTPAMIKRSTVVRAVGGILRNGHKKNSHSVSDGVAQSAPQPDSIQLSIFSSEKRKETIMRTTLGQQNVFRQTQKLYRRSPSKEMLRNIPAEELSLKQKRSFNNHSQERKSLVISSRSPNINLSPSPERISIGKKGSVYLPQYRPVSLTSLEELASPIVIKMNHSKHEDINLDQDSHPRVSCFSKRINTLGHSIKPIQVQKSNEFSHLMVFRECSITEE